MARNYVIELTILCFSTTRMREKTLIIFPKEHKIIYIRRLIFARKHIHYNRRSVKRLGHLVSSGSICLLIQRQCIGFISFRLYFINLGNISTSTCQIRFFLKPKCFSAFTRPNNHSQANTHMLQQSRVIYNCFDPLKLKAH